MTLELHHGDCLEVMRDLSDASVDLFMCDLPYGCLSVPRASIGPGWRKVKEQGGTPKLIRQSPEICAWDVKLDLDAFWKEVKRLRRSDNTPCLMFCTTRFGYELIKSNPEEFRYDIVWSKSLGVGFLQANKAPLRSHEMIYVFSKKGAYYKRIDIEGAYKKAGGGRNASQMVYGSGYRAVESDNTGKRCVKSVVEVSTVRKKGQHPTEKPMELYSWLIERYCPPEGTVLDPTAGSFNSVFAAFALDRSAIGIEKEEGFYKRGVERLEALTEEDETVELSL